MERLMNLARGCVRVEITGARPTEALERLSAAGVPFWGARPHGEFTLRLSVRSGDAARVRALAERALCSAELRRERGLPAIAGRLRRRAALVVSAVTLLLAVMASTFFIWDVDITGNESVPDGDILRALEEAGVRIGAFWPDFDGDMIRNRVILQNPRISWLAVNVRSGRAEVIVREITAKPELYDARVPTDVISAATGIITRMSVLEGVPRVKAGDAVIKGETLVSSRWEALFTGDIRYSHARADVEARTWYEISARIPLETMVKEYGGPRRTRWALRLGERRINFYDSSRNTPAGCDKIIAEYPLAVEGVFTLPLALIRESVCRYELTPAPRDAGEAEAELRAALLTELSRRLDGRGEPVSTDFFVSEAGGALTVTLRAECLEDIAVEIPAEEIPQ